VRRGNGLDALCVGESMVLLAPDPPGRLRESTRLRVHVAGAESTVAAYLAQLGARAAWMSRIGADPLGEIVRDRVARFGVDTTGVGVETGAPTGVYFKDPGPAGTAVHYYRRGSAASTMDRMVWTDAPPARVVHLTGITPALSDPCADLVAHGLAARPVSGAVMSFDVNYRPGLWPVAEAAPVLAGLANLADVVFVGLDEAGTLWRCHHPDGVRALLPKPGRVVVKDGAHAVSYGPAGRTVAPAPPVEVLEPVGAGDAFAAGYLAGLPRDRPEEERLRLGHRVAAAALRSMGDMAPLDPAAFTSMRMRGTLE